MSGQRFDCDEGNGAMFPDECGDWVKATDYIAITQERDQLRANVERLSAPVSEEEESAGHATYEHATRRRFDAEARKHAVAMAMGWLITARRKP